ncbi:hypothetical protein C0993_002140 [Termitomyces sp. T159_Od127]|nr:hypothetical protein C0993_002140 [Termitomyces sp. T159_Od127]
MDAAAEESSDPALLFTPKKSLELSHDAEISSQLSTTSPTVPPQRAFFICPPHIDDEKKKLYKPAGASSLKIDPELLLDEVIGRYREHNVTYYYARYQGGLAHKKFKHLVDEYNRKDAAGQLEPFDPSARYIHPLSRMKLTVSINNRRGTTKILSSRSIKPGPESEIISDSEENYTNVDDLSGDDESDFEGEDNLLLRRTSGRLSVKRKQALPFSPKKTRSARVFAIDSDLETGTSEQNATVIPTRRSARDSRRIRKELIDLDSDIDTDGADLSYDDDDTYSSRQHYTKIKSKKPMRKRASRPAYGNLRSVVDLDYDSHSDEEIAVLWKHRDICEKCHQPPAHKLLQKLSKRARRRSKKRKTEDEFEESGDEEERLISLGGWVRCLKCPVVAHWKCLASTQRDEILKAARDKDCIAWQRNQGDNEDFSSQHAPTKRSGLDPDQTTEFICGACMKGGSCMFCMEVALEAEAVQKEKTDSAIQHDGPTEDSPQPSTSQDATELRWSAKRPLFRCLTCKRLAHYEHLPPPSHLSSGDSIADIAQHYTQSWLCADCASYTFGVDKIIAWRPYPSTAVEPAHSRDEPPNYKSSLPREYLVKWIDRSFRRVQWVPHMWLLSTHPAKLKNFLMGGSKVELLATSDVTQQEKEEPGSSELDQKSRRSNAQKDTLLLPRDPLADAEHRIPLAWKTIDRLLDVLLWRTQRHHSKRKQQKKGKGKQSSTSVDSADDSEDELDEDIREEREIAYDRGEQPSDDLLETVSEWETRTGRTFSEKNIGQVAWSFIKWEDLGYDEASWDSPPRPSDPTYPAFESALRRYVYSRTVIVMRHPKSYCEKFDNRTKDQYRTRHALKDAGALDIGQDQRLQLMPFQVDGFNWLCNNWWNLQPCILADEMGLGKTVQVATFLGYVTAKFKAFPALVVVPNSTITNWVREFERWAPNLRVVPFYGEAKAREIIKKYELYHGTKSNDETGAKFHVLISTYETLLNQKDFTPVFKNQPRWEVSDS